MQRRPPMNRTVRPIFLAALAVALLAALAAVLS